MDDIMNMDEIYILQDEGGTRWRFYLSENKRIGYSVNRLGNWSSHEYIDSQPIKGYSATMDNKGVIRLVAYTITRQLLYYEFVNGNWDSKIIERIYSRFQDIPYYYIHSSASGVHILYYINHSLSRSGESVMHYYFHEGKWQGKRLWKFMSDQVTKPQSLYLDNEDNLHMLFTQRWRNRVYLYYSSYDPISLSWIEPIAIHSSQESHDYKIFADSARNLHILWVRDTGHSHRIFSLSKFQDDEDGWRESSIHESPHKVKTPVMLEDRELQCFWKEGSSIYRMYSGDLGHTWSAPKLVHNGMDYESTLLNLIFWDNDTPIALNLWGQGYPDIQFAGVAESLIASKRQITEEEESESLSLDNMIHQQRSTDRFDVERILIPLKRENQGLREGVNNLFSQIDHLNSIIYNLQDQIQMNEKNLFNINAQIKQLDFQIKQLQLRARQISPRIYNVLGDDAGQKIQQDQIAQEQNRGTYPDSRDEDAGAKAIAKDIHPREDLEDNEHNEPQAGQIEESKEKTEKQIGPERRDQRSPRTQEFYVKDEGEKTQEGDENNKSQGDDEEESRPHDHESKEKEDIQKISLGNTVVLINPENPEDC